MNDSAIIVKNLTKKFGKFTAVDQVNFTVKKGEIFGFLGANGAGKSTTIRMLCALLNSTSGTAEVAGYDINRQPELVKRNIGYMSQRFSLYNDLTVEENISFFGGVYGLSDRKIEERKKWALYMSGLEGKEKRLTGELPLGWKQRLALGCAVLHEPQIVFLDEPTSGVDPLSRRNFWQWMNDLSQEGITVFVTTHYLDEAEYCNTIMLIHSGKIIAGGSPDDLKREHIQNTMLELECDKVFEIMEMLVKTDFAREISLFGTYLHLSVHDVDSAIAEIKSICQRKGITIIRLDEISPSLEDVFIHLVKE